MSNTSYVQNNPDLLAHYNANVAGTGQTMAEFGAQHWENFGKDENRSVTPAKSSSTDVFTAEDYTRTVSSGSEQVSGHDQSGGDYLNYVLNNPDLRENAEALGLTQSEMSEWGELHWNEWGSRTIESRGNTPFATASPSARYAEWELGENVPIVYAGQTIEEVLQNSIRSQYKGADVDDYEMWESREQIAPAWNQGQFTGQGWNMAADQPYGTGILADQIEVNRDIGQLVPTTAAGNVGDLRFLQDRYIDEAIANDFPVGWTTPENTWAAAAPQQLGNYWDVLTNAYRTPEGILRRAEDYDPLTAVGPSVSPGPRGGGNVRGGPTGTGTGVGTTGTGTGGGILGNIPFQDWSRFMPTPTPYYQLGEFAGAHYQPWATGTPAVSAGMGGGAGGFAGPDLPSGYNVGGGAAATGGGGTTGVPGVTYTPTNIWGDTTTGGNVTTDTSGKQWVMSPGGQWYPADSDYGEGLLGTGRLFYDQHYDSSGAYVGSEGSTEWGEIKTGPHQGEMGWINRHTGELEPRPTWGIQLPGPGENLLDTKFVQSGLLPYYQTAAGKLDPWAPVSNEEWVAKMVPQSVMNTRPANQINLQPSITGPLSFQNFTTAPGTPGYQPTLGYVDPGTQAGWGNFGGSYAEGLEYGDDVDIDTGYGTGLYT